MTGPWARVKQTVKPALRTFVGGACLLFGVTGCAGFWEELMSHERDWDYVWRHNLPDPLVVLKDPREGGSDDGMRRHDALLRMKEPLQNGGDDMKQNAYLEKLSITAMDDERPLCRMAAIRTLGTYRDPRAARALEYVYEQPRMPFNAETNGHIRQQALVALENAHDPESLKLFIRVARQPGPTPEASQADRQQTQDERIVAVRALKNYHNQEGADALAYVLQREKDVALRHLALASLQDITGKEWPETYDAWQRDELHPQPGLATASPSIIQQVSGFFNK